MEYNRTQRQIQLSDPNMHGALLLLFPSAGPKTIIIKKLKKNVSMVETARAAKGRGVKGNELYCKWALK